MAISNDLLCSKMNKELIVLPQLEILLGQHLRQTHYPAANYENEVTGNGALVQLAPVLLFFYRQPIVDVEYSDYSGQITHGDQRTYDACRYYGALIEAVLHDEVKEYLLSEDFYQNHKSWVGYRTGGIRGRDYIISALVVALWAF
ncbi:unnamed protein product [Rotaria sp. Silwood2]|nr:unnamed protein product [Rotaria sp. Silwood2]